MIATTPLDQALEAWKRSGTAPRQARVDDAVALLEWDLFSINQVSAITRLPWHFVRGLSRKTTHTGGALNPATLPLLQILRDQYRAGERPVAVAQGIWEAGTRQAMTSALTGVPMSTLYRWMRHG